MQYSLSTLRTRLVQFPIIDRVSLQSKCCEEKKSRDGGRIETKTQSHDMFIGHVIEENPLFLAEAEKWKKN